MQQVITNEVIDKAMGFDDYMALTVAIVNSEAPTGRYENPNTFRYTRSNLERMEKVLKNIVINQKLYNQLSELKEEWVWVVLTEPWCGDAAWGTPTLYILAGSTDTIDFRILLRDEHPEIMKHFQTNGGDAIPKLVCLRKSNMEVLGTWGPRPQVLQKQVMQWKDTPGMDYKESVRKIHAWYDEDMAKAIQDEFIDLIKDWKTR